jgi:hypothetical protein
MTFSMLQSIAKNRESIFNILKKKVSLILVDEGHYEPAKKWSKLVRKEIKAPKILFTATPYRNDFQVFDIDLDYIFTFSFKSAVKERYIRDIEIINRLLDKFTPDSFIDDVVEFYHQQFPKFSLYENIEDFNKDPDEMQEKILEKPRIIIRCDESISIKHLAKALDDRNIRCVGIHDTFNEHEDWERKKVPSIDDKYAMKADVWIHQFKLLEGIDDSRFQVLAIYERIRSARPLVQQIGRIIRNPRREDGAKGYFLEHWDGYHEELWRGFLKYDEAIRKDGKDAFAMSTGKGILYEYMEKQPKIAYVDGRFRSKFNFKDIYINEDIQVPLRVNIFRKLEKFEIEKFIEFITEEYKKQDRIIETKTSSSLNLHVIISIRSRNAPNLRNHVFIEADLFVTIIWALEEYLFIYDSSSMNWIKYDYLDPMEVDDLKKLFNEESSKLTRVSLKNAYLGTSTIRSRTITASSIEATIPSFDDHAQICTIAEGYSIKKVNDDKDERIRRYVGFTRGRISQHNDGYVPLSEYIIWLKLLYAIINENRNLLPIFSRYAVKRDIPKQTDPRYILLDFVNILDVYVTTGKDPQTLEVVDVCSEVEGGLFSITANGIDIPMKVIFDKNKYVITSIKMESNFRRKNDAIDFDKNIIRQINDSKSFSILPEALDTIYTYGSFYSPKIKFGVDFNKDAYVLGHCFVTDNTIGMCTSEKGSEVYYQTHDTNWDPNSHFGIISRLGVGTSVENLFGNPTIIVCDCGGIEIADFILCDTEHQRIVFIHAKAMPPGTLVSASKLHDICAQTIKNLGYFMMFNDEEPSKINSWNGPWRDSGNTRGVVYNRIFRADPRDTNHTVWSKIRRVINNPLADKEVWLFTGNILSKAHFETQIMNPNPRKNVIQAGYLLHATMAEVASVGAKLRIFCME